MSTDSVRDKVIELRKSMPCASNQTIADKVGVSRERVRQILKSSGLPTRKYYATCSECGKKIQSRNKGTLCRECGVKHNSVPIICDTCGKLFYRRQSQMLSNRMKHTGYYCSKQCWGKKMGTLYGFAVNKEHRRSTKRKYDYSIIWKKYQEGIEPRVISKELGVPLPSLFEVLHRIRKGVRLT